MNSGPAPIIVSALFGDVDFAFFNGLRRMHYPPERNVLPAHLTLFHHLPPSIERELRVRLADAARSSSPLRGTATNIFSLGTGVAYRIDCPGLDAIRCDLAEAFTALLTPQDAAGWRPHVTIQNKVSTNAARQLLGELQRHFVPRPVTISGLAAWWYRGGSWEPIARYPFRG